MHGELESLLSGNLYKKLFCSRAFLSLLLSARCRKICYEAQELIIFLTDKYGFETEQGD